MTFNSLNFPIVWQLVTNMIRSLVSKMIIILLIYQICAIGINLSNIFRY